MSHTTRHFHVYTVTRVATGRVVYVGMTDDPKRRWAHHRCGSSAGLLADAIAEFGSDAFLFEVQYEMSARSRAFAMELALIKKYGTDADDFGYNRKPSGGAGLRNTNARSRAVQQLTTDGRLVATFRSINEASDRTGIHRTAINRIINGRPEYTAGGYRWALQ